MCCDDEINEQRILIAPLPVHRAVANARCRCLQGGVASHMKTGFLQTSFMDDSLVALNMPNVSKDKNVENLYQNQ